MFWMPDQVRHDDLGTFYEAVKVDALVKSQKPAFRSWFDTSPRTENQLVTVRPIRSP
jgi:hypothetical protein